MINRGTLNTIPRLSWKDL